MYILNSAVIHVCVAQLTLPTRKIKYLPRRGSISDALHANKTKYYGRLAQLVAHLNDIQRVTSSSLVTPTIKKTITFVIVFFIMFIQDENAQGKALRNLSDL